MQALCIPTLFALLNAVKDNLPDEVVHGDESWCFMGDIVDSRDRDLPSPAPPLDLHHRSRLLKDGILLGTLHGNGKLA